MGTLLKPLVRETAGAKYSPKHRYWYLVIEERKDTFERLNINATTQHEALLLFLRKEQNHNMKLPETSRSTRLKLTEQNLKTSTTCNCFNKLYKLLFVWPKLQFWPNLINCSSSGPNFNSGPIL